MTKTTGLYKELNPTGDVPGPASYITLNPRESEAIRQTFRLRSGSSTLRADRETRHLSRTSICRMCGIHDETARHVFDQCPALRDERRKTKKKLNKCFYIHGETMSDILLANYHTELRLMRGGQQNN